jgi:drug/metabolite transporter (DMT)-like permease
MTRSRERMGDTSPRTGYFAALVLRERIGLLQWICIAAILIGRIFCT